MTAPASISTFSLIETLRTQLLNFVSPAPGAVSIASLINKRFWITQAPDKASYPYGVMRIPERRNRRPPRYRNEIDVEVQFFGRKRSDMQLIDQMADTAEQALIGFMIADQGAGMIQTCQRNEVIYDNDPADREIMQVRLLFSGYVYVAYLWPGLSV